VTAVKLSVAGFLTLSAFCPCSFCFQGESPTVSEIVHRSVLANTVDWNAQPQYTHRERDIKTKIDGSGRVQIAQSRTVEISLLDGSPYSRLVAIDNQPLNRQQQDEEQSKFAAELARRRHESASDRRARITKYQAERADEHTLMQQMVDAFTFSLAGEQSVGGVNCYVLDAKPNPAYQPPVEKARVLLGMKGRLWIDKEHHHWVKVEAEVINPVQFGLFVAKVKPGTRFELEQAAIGDVWLPKYFSQSVNATVFGFYAMRNNEEDLYSDYRPVRMTSAPVQLSAKAAVSDSANRPSTSVTAELVVR